MNPTALLEHLAAQQPAMLELLAELVRHESPSHDKARNDALALRLAGLCREAGAQAEVWPNPGLGDHVRAVFGGGAPAPALLLCHYDTVWAAGTLEHMPFRIAEGRAWGPGVYDMKASIVMALFAIKALAALGLTAPRPLVLLLTSDEEIGSPGSRALIEAEARKAAHVLVLEPPTGTGALKTARKGIGLFELAIGGRAAHAGVEPEKGASAIVELAHQILALAALNDLAQGTTVNVGVVQGGTRSNVVAAHAAAAIDVRAWTMAEATRIEAALRALRPQIAATTLELRGGFNRPPMERSATAALFARARELGAALGLDLHEGATGGGSDGNFTAALGVPTLDGLGSVGGGAHADHEHIELAALPERTALLAMMLSTL